jgi:preprotein translocase SecE subunit
LHNTQAENNVANKKAKKSAKAPAKSDSNVVRIRATSSAPKAQKSEVKEQEVTTKVVASGSTKAAKEKTPKAPRMQRKGRGPRALRATGGYFKGAWVELRQVRWPNRRATWGLTAAVLAYSAFFVVIVLLLDALFKYLFELILGK